jgi:ribosomal protection tetracycline resistance protein
MPVINLGILAHVDAGKTTLTERFLHISGAIRKPGSVDGGDAHTDSMDVERERGISVKASSARFSYKGAEVNLIDTPGHADFSGEIERSLRALDNAVLVVSAVEGVQAQTEVIWQALKELRIPVFVFINKTDRVGAATARVTAEIENRFNVTTFDPSSPRALEALCENDLTLLEKYLDSPNGFSQAEILQATRKQFAARQIFPLLSGSALDNINVEPFLDTVVTTARYAEGNEEAPVSALVYRVEHHPSLGRLAHVRLFGGRLVVRGEAENRTGNIKEKVAQLKKYSGTKLTDATELTAGDCGVVCGWARSGIGGIYGDASAVPQNHAMTRALITVKIHPRDEADYPKLLDATRILNDEDPLLNMVWAHGQRELLISVTGLMQIEILEHIYKNRFGLTVAFGSPTVIYKETPSAAGEGFEAYTMPKPCWAIIKFLIEPLETGAGFIYESKVGPDTVPARYQSQIAQAMPDALRQGPKGWEITDLRVTLIDGDAHVYHTHPLDFIITTPMALFNGLVNTGTDLLEPYMAFELTVPEALNVKILGEITRMGGRYDETSITDGSFAVRGVYPLANGLRFPLRVHSLTSGRGVLRTRFSHYEKTPPGFDATQPYRGVSPLDRAKYILHIRKAL